MKRFIFRISILTGLLFVAASVNAQTNLLLNPNADGGTENWRASKEATVEEFNGNKVFVVRNQSSFVQDVKLEKTAAGKFALLIGHGSSERINGSGAITGLPYLYGYMLGSKNSKGGIIYEYLQGQQMRARTQTKDEWTTMFGIFQVPPGVEAISFFLNQAERKDVPQNGSAARFDNVGLYLFETEEAALKFAKAY